MTEYEANERFNLLPRDIRTTIIGQEICTEIHWLMHEKSNYMKEHEKNMRRINEKIKTLQRSLSQLKDD